jgi:hypothetical protein
MSAVETPHPQIKRAVGGTCWIQLITNPEEITTGKYGGRRVTEFEPAISFFLNLNLALNLNPGF